MVSTFVILSFIFFHNQCRKSDYFLNETVSIRDNGAGTGTVTWKKDKSYLIEGLVFVNDGQILTIEPGTVIRAKTGQGRSSSALIIARGGKIMAEGTANDPIIFTCEGDDLKGSVPVKAKGLWGGLIVLGNARLNTRYNENSIEGIPVSEPRGVYGGNNDDDNSGILKYISIRHGGTDIGEENEINGLTLGGVGRETIIEHIEVISNADDGYEFFGGTVNTRYLIAAFCGDDAFDYDEGYRGNGQFWLAIMSTSEGDHMLECNGGISPENGLPYSLPGLYNLTLIGSGTNTSSYAIDFSRNAGGNIGNSIIVNQINGIKIEFKENLESSFNQFENQNLSLKNNIFYDIAGNDSSLIFSIYSDTGVEVIEQNNRIRSYFSEAGNIINDPALVYQNDMYNPIPGNIVFTDFAPYPSPWFETANFKGAFGTYNWASGWTLLSRQGFFTE